MNQQKRKRECYGYIIRRCITVMLAHILFLLFPSFNLRSDLLFVHNPDVPKNTKAYVTTYYRDEEGRGQRLTRIIKTEALHYIEGGDTELSELASRAWCWMCSNDRYADVVKKTIEALPIEAVRFLARTENPKSEPIQNQPIKDCSSPKCAWVLQSRLCFLGRYILDSGSPLLHKSESGVVFRAKDIGAMDSYISIQSLLNTAEPDIDDYSHACGSCYGITGNSIEVHRFTNFTSKIGISEEEALAELEKLVDDETDFKEGGVKQSVFKDFCNLYSIGDDGSRSVVIKFILRKQSYELEKQCRDILSESRKRVNVVPILNHFSLEGNGNTGSNDFIKDPFIGGPPLIDIDLIPFKYGIVMPAANGDLRDIFYRQGMSSSYMRDNIRQVGGTLQALHEQGITFNNLQLKNVLQFGKEMALSDFGSALFLKSIEGFDAIGGSSQRLVSTSILPPEMVAKVELSKLDQFMDYWKYVHPDASCLKALTPHERDAISQFVESGDEEDWKNGISDLLETITFEDLPPPLSESTSFEEFCISWGRKHENYTLWEFVRPRINEKTQCAYMFKSFDNREKSPQDVSALPYEPVPPSEKVDVWQLGIFIFELCSGGNPFQTGLQGDLRGVDSYSRLYEWSRLEAQRSVREHVNDPLAQDLLCQILVPVAERLPTISAVLGHPFFSPKSIEAERFLERHEEIQLLRENTITVPKVTRAVSTMLDQSMEKYCKLAFATDQIAIPCCLILLPYTVSMDESTNKPIALSVDPISNISVSDPMVIVQMEKLGKCLLGINKATARLSFWLMMMSKMKAPIGNLFKTQLQDWLRRVRYEPSSSIAEEIVATLDCDPSYIMICEEVLAEDGSVSKAKSYMRDPVRAARREIKHNSDSIVELYQSMSYLYLVDEATMVPSCSSGQSSLYPMELEPNQKLIVNVLLPFMNVVVMKALARNGFEGLANLLGLPASLGIPDSWKASEPGLIHSINNNDASIEEFVTLQSILRKDDLSDFQDDASAAMNMSYHSGISSTFDDTSFLSISALRLTTADLSPVNPGIAGIPMIQLELLFRERDPSRDFGQLRRVTSGDTGLGLWTNVEGVQMLKSMVEMAELEEKLRELKMNLEQTKNAAVEYANLMSKRKELKQNIPYNEMRRTYPFSYDISFDESTGSSRGSAKKAEDDEQQATDDEEEGLKEESEPKQEPPSEETEGDIRMTNRTTRTTDPYPRADDDGRDETAQQKKKMRKSKRRFRPWFTAC